MASFRRWTCAWYCAMVSGCTLHYSRTVYVDLLQSAVQKQGPTSEETPGGSHDTALHGCMHWTVLRWNGGEATGQCNLGCSFSTFPSS